MSDSKLWKAEEEVLELESGHGVVSGPLCNSATAKYRLGRSR